MSPVGTSSVLVVCGALRNHIEFLEVLRQCRQSVEQGFASRIILSTWAGEIDRALAAHLSKSGVDVVEVPPVQERDGLNPSAHGHIVRQKKLLREGLRLVDGDQHVTRLRTDYCLKELKSPILTAAAFGAPVEPSARFALRRRISILEANASLYFDINDLVFSGLKSDLVQITASTDAYDVDAAASFFVAEMRWFSTPFLAHGVFRSLFESASQLKFAAWVRDDAGGAEGAPSFFYRAQVAYYRVLTSCFNLLRRAPFDPALRFGARDFFVPVIDGHSVQYRDVCGRLETRDGLEAIVDPGRYEAGAARDALETWWTSERLFDEMTDDERLEIEAFASANAIDMLGPAPRRTPASAQSASPAIDPLRELVASRAGAHLEDVQAILASAEEIGTRSFLVSEHLRAKADPEAGFFLELACSMICWAAIDRFAELRGERWASSLRNIHDAQDLRNFGYTWITANAKPILLEAVAAASAAADEA